MGDITASPRNKLLGLLADAANSVDQFASAPFGYDNPPGRMISGLLGIPSVGKTLDRMSYGESLGTGSGMTWKPKPETVDAALMAVPLAVSLAPSVARGAVSTAKFVAPKVGQIAEDYMVQTGGILPATVWHGSPHKFDKFDASKIGTGEGAQAYGHGLYLAESPEVAKEYQRALGTGIDLEGKPVMRGGKLVGTTGNRLLDSNMELYAGDLNQGIKDQLSILRDKRYRLSLADDKNSWAYKANKEVLKEEQKQLAAMRNLRNNGTFINDGSLYKVDLPDEAIAKMLDWDKPLSEQHPDVQAAVKPLLDGQFDVRGYGGGWGSLEPDASAVRDVYTKSGHSLGTYSASDADNLNFTGSAIVKALGNMDKESASTAELLRNAGIPGIRYLDGGSRGTGQGTSNFVVFPGNEGLLTILERNGQPVKQPFAYPQDQALETARKNAVEMLGLPENNTAMDRARALGFRSEQFHETTAPKLEQIAQQGFDPRKAFAAASDNETPYGVFTKDSGRSIGLAKEGEVQLPLLVRTNEGTPAFYNFADRSGLSSRLGVWNPEISRLQAAQNMDEAARAKQIDALGEMLGTRAHPNTSGMSNSEIWKQIDDLAAGDTALSAQTKDLITKELGARGIQTIRLGNDAGSMGRSTETTISLNPANIRSRFAAFDPARVNENDLLGGIDPTLAGLLAAGTGGAVAAKKYGLLNY